MERERIEKKRRKKKRKKREVKKTKPGAHKYGLLTKQRNEEKIKHKKVKTIEERSFPPKSGAISVKVTFLILLWRTCICVSCRSILYSV